MRVCKKCKTYIHENSLYDYCNKCYGKVEEIFEKIRIYLKEYPGATAYEMQERLGIPAHVINNFVKDGRLEEIPNEYLNVECMRCKCLLLSAHHKYCPACEVEIHKELENAKQYYMSKCNEGDAKGKMRFKIHERNK